MVARLLKIGLPAYAVFEVLRWVVVEWFPGIVNGVKAEIAEVMNDIAVALDVPTGPLAKVNAVIPLMTVVNYLVQDTFGGHTMAVEGFGTYVIKNAELYDMGQATVLGRQE